MSLTTDDQTALRELLDAREIEQAFVRYFDRVDANDPEGASQCFAEDVEFEIMTGKRKRGRDSFARSLGRVLDQYERTSTVVINAYLQPIMQRYLESLEARAQARSGTRRTASARSPIGTTRSFFPLPSQTDSVPRRWSTL